MATKNKKTEYQDDGHTIYNMDGVGHDRPWRRKIKDDDGVSLTKKERRAAIRAAFLTYGPMLLIALAGFALVMGLMYVWLG